MKNILPFLLCLVVFISCKKDNPTELPEATQTGENTFGARIDGEIWMPEPFSSIINSNILEAKYSGTGGLLINASNFKSSPTETEFEIYIHQITGPGTFLLNQNTEIFPMQTANYGYFVKRKFSPLNEWITDATHAGSVTITRYDTVAHTVSGTFEFTAGNIDSTTNAIKVTEGRFDVKISN
jgi:hypothetical protein